MMIIETLTERGWEQRKPIIGETYRLNYPTGHRVTMELKENDAKLPELLPIVFTSVEGAATSNSDLTKITAKVGSTFTINGTLTIPDQVFITPIEKVNIATDEVTTEYISTQVVDGQFSILLTLASGKYRVTQELMNKELATPRFSMSDVEIYITI
ncbi:TPA: hypothetical protein I7235_01515 [Vibrio vulnificus]|nr:hypothetical protein [Vibrio vulnificus]HDY7590598.1 hypothetical protein [Vibrio vulnificus]